MSEENEKNNAQVVEAQPGDVKESKKSKMKVNFKSKKTWIVILVVLAIVGLGYFAYSYMEAKKEVERLSNPQEAAKQQIQELVEMVSKIVELPANETPTVATVNDASKLSSQAFFANAQNGDKVLIYPQAKKAILYRPSTNKVINVAPINIGNNQAPCFS
jgi:predicted negative regulator of RcsB-dependent stress response